jgi:hypothetical protein
MPTLLGQRLPRHQTRTFRSGYCERGKTDSKCDAIGWPQPAPRHWQFPRSGDRAHQQHCAARRTSSASICCRPSCPATSESMTGAGGKDQSKWRRRRSNIPGHQGAGPRPHIFPTCRRQTGTPRRSANPIQFIAAARACTASRSSPQPGLVLIALGHRLERCAPYPQTKPASGSHGREAHPSNI